MSAQLLLKVKCMLSAAPLADHALNDITKEVSVADSQATALQIYSQSGDVVLTAQREANVQKNRNPNGKFSVPAGPAVCNLFCSQRNVDCTQTKEGNSGGF